MTGPDVLLDTVIVADWLNNRPEVIQRIKDVTPYISAITVGELFFGAYQSRRQRENTARIRDIEGLFGVLQVGSRTGQIYGRLKGALRTKGRPIPENDIWIASSAIEFGLRLVTRDHHFDYLDELQIERWPVSSS